jgi:predicted transcriptional regulator of viral defense system
MASARTKYRKIEKQISEGTIVRIGKGVYATPKNLEGIEGDFFRATQLCSKNSTICLLSALGFYGLSEQVFGGVWILIPYSSYAPRKKFLRVVRSRRPHWRLGIQSTPHYKITTIERSIVDAFRYQRLVGISTAIYAIKTALSERQTTKEKIYDMAKKLNADKKILPYLEAL